jgi:hypothetical protein
MYPHISKCPHINHISTHSCSRGRSILTLYHIDYLANKNTLSAIINQEWHKLIWVVIFPIITPRRLMLTSTSHIDLIPSATHLLVTQVMRFPRIRVCLLLKRDIISILQIRVRCFIVSIPRRIRHHLIMGFNLHLRLQFITLSTLGNRTNDLSLLRPHRLHQSSVSGSSFTAIRVRKVSSARRTLTFTLRRIT